MPTAAATATDQRATAVRRFNRFYTRQIGVLNEGLLQSPFSLGEARVLYELAQDKGPSASELSADLGLDAGYLSRMLRRFERRGLIAREPSESDGRRSLVALTRKGRAAFATLDARSHDEVREMLSRLAEPDQRHLLEAMRTVERLLGAPSHPAPGYLLRTHQPGDMGWVVHRHGVLYAQEYGWDEQFEALVADIVAQFLRRFDPKHERCWIAEREGDIVGSVFLVKESDTVAKLRLLLVEPSARGLGIGNRLVTECVRTARRMSYRKLTLWTQQSLPAARRIYQQAGFRLVGSEPHHSFGHDLIGETWDLDL
ncbi:MAG TPA: helix-turn-helix domain-containing GNAT family N-acetyltransferase [Gemmatimonadales bacterium]|nr:helix-turn-helix domain-containing GNAT family N-acetyltransferase [Gemmatimonadales bacterium]